MADDGETPVMAENDVHVWVRLIESAKSKGLSETLHVDIPTEKKADLLGHFPGLRFAITSEAWGQSHILVWLKAGREEKPDGG